MFLQMIVDMEHGSYGSITVAFTYYSCIHIDVSWGQWGEVTCT